MYGEGGLLRVGSEADERMDNEGAIADTAFSKRPAFVAISAKSSEAELLQWLGALSGAMALNNLNAAMRFEIIHKPLRSVCAWGAERTSA